MPEESINIFINNIYSITIFVAVVFFIFIILFLMSRFFIYDRKKNESFNKPEHSKPEQADSQLPKGAAVIKYSGFHLNKDIYLAKNLFVFGTAFVLVIFFILLLLLTLNFVEKFQLNGSLFLIIGIVFLIIFTAVYFVKSKFITK